MRFAIQECSPARWRSRDVYVCRSNATCVRGGTLRTLPARARIPLQGRTGLPLIGASRASSTRSISDPVVLHPLPIIDSPPTRRGVRPRLGVFKFASCDGCQLSLLDCEDELLAVADRVEIAFFREATPPAAGGTARRGPRRRVHLDARAGGGDPRRPPQPLPDHLGGLCLARRIQALRNFGARRTSWASFMLHPRQSPPWTVRGRRVITWRVDLELPGCPINKRQLLSAFGSDARRRTPPHDEHRALP